MPPPRIPIHVDGTEAEELCSSSSHDAVEVGDEKPEDEAPKISGKDRSRSRDSPSTKPVAKQREKNSSRNKQSQSRSKGLPPGWVRVKSKTKPGAYYYAHPATNRTQTELPMDIYAGLEPVTEKSEEQQPAKASVEKPLGPSHPTPADKLKAVAEEAERKRREAEDARKTAQEKALRKKQEFDDTLRRVQEQEKAEIAAQEEELRKKREKRQEKAAEIAKASQNGSNGKEISKDDGESSKEIIKPRPEKGRGRGKVAGLFFAQSAPEPPLRSPEPDAEDEKPSPAKPLTKKEKKEQKKRKAAEKQRSKEAKKLKKKMKKEKKIQKQIKKAEKQLQKSKDVLKTVGGCRHRSSSSSSTSSSSSS